MWQLPEGTPSVNCPPQLESGPLKQQDAMKIHEVMVNAIVFVPTPPLEEFVARALT